MSRDTIKEFKVYKNLTVILYHLLMSPKSQPFSSDCNKVGCYVKCHLNGRKLHVEVNLYD